ncbi:MAG: aspartate-semialdehyde dehydrogenase [Legionellales bacterium]|nr:aspartate-semialdehyde dehydrogenase [Legionellales bacterium]
MTEKKYNVAVVGATGMVGRTMLSILEERNFPVDKVYALASSRSVGTRIPFKDSELVIGDLETFDFNLAEIGLFSPGASVSAIYAPKAVDAGCVVIDNTSKFRYEDDIPLVVSEVNPHAIGDYKNRGIIANPNCSTIQMLVALKPIYDAVGIERINVCTYQAVSGTGQAAVDELNNQALQIIDERFPYNQITSIIRANNPLVSSTVYPKQIACNVLPHIDAFQDNGYTKEEMKMVWETQKIFEDDSILVNPTAVRVPVYHGHSEAVHIETKEKIDVKTARKLLEEMPGVTVIDSHEDGGYPTAVTEAAGTDPVFVGRIREDISHPRGLNMWVVADNLRKGAALNSVQIAEILVKSYI